MTDILIACAKLRLMSRYVAELICQIALPDSCWSYIGEFLK